MKKVDEIDEDDISAEIDFSRGERGGFTKRFAEGTNLVPLAPDAESVNNALRLMAQVAPRTARLEKVR